MLPLTVLSEDGHGAGRSAEVPVGVHAAAVVARDVAHDGIAGEAQRSALDGDRAAVGGGGVGGQDAVGDREGRVAGEDRPAVAGGAVAEREPRDGHCLTGRRVGVEQLRGAAAVDGHLCGAGPVDRHRRGDRQRGGEVDLAAQAAGERDHVRIRGGVGVDDGLAQRAGPGVAQAGDREGRRLRGGSDREGAGTDRGRGGQRGAPAQHRLAPAGLVLSSAVGPPECSFTHCGRTLWGR